MNLFLPFALALERLRTALATLARLPVGVIFSTAALLAQNAVSRWAWSGPHWCLLRVWHLDQLAVLPQARTNTLNWPTCAQA